MSVCFSQKKNLVSAAKRLMLGCISRLENVWSCKKLHLNDMLILLQHYRVIFYPIDARASTACSFVISSVHPHHMIFKRFKNDLRERPFFRTDF